MALGIAIVQERRGGEQLDIVSLGGGRAWREDFSTQAGIVEFAERLTADVQPGPALHELMQGNQLDVDLASQLSLS